MNNQPLYDLTKMTGRRAPEDRTVVIGYTEMRWRTFIVGLVGMGVGIFASLFFYWILGGWVLLTVIPACIAGTIWLVEGRSKRGLRRRHYEAIIDRRTAVINRFMVGPVVVEVPRGKWLRVRSGTLGLQGDRVDPEADEKDDPVYATWGQTKAAQSGAVNDIFGG